VRYIIYGAGAVGGSLGAHLFEAGRDVAFVARGEHGRAIASSGLRFGSTTGWRNLRIPVFEHPSQLTFGANDVVVLALKSQDTTNALDTLAPLTGPELPIVCAQNGVANERRALRRFANVHGMRVMLAGVHLEPGVIHMHHPPFGASCDLGRIPHGHDDLDSTFAADLEASGIRSRVCDDILSRKYAKLISNLTNVLEAASGPSAAQSSLGERARSEAQAVFAAAGIVSDRGPLEPHAAMPLVEVEGVSRPGGSTYQSLARGASSLEGNDLNGEIVLLGRLHAVATPVNLMLQQLGLRLVAEKRSPGTIPVAELERAVEGSLR
jgi:2-dehydropantoate 2-reductase